MDPVVLTRKQRWVLSGLILAWITAFWVAWYFWPYWWLFIPFTVIGILGSTIFTRRITPH